MNDAASARENSSAAVRVRSVPGEIRVDAACLFTDGDDRVLHALLERVLVPEPVRAVDVDRTRQSLTIKYDSKLWSPETALSRIGQALRRGATPGDDVPKVRLGLDQLDGAVTRVARDQDEASPLTLALLVRRAANFTVAAGCFGMSLVGLVVPGVPTVPFVLATSYFLARSSPALNERLKRSKLFGPMVRDWDEHHGLRPSTKLKALAATGAIIVVSMVLAGPSLLLLALMAGMSLIGVAIVLRLPTIPEQTGRSTQVLSPVVA